MTFTADELIWFAEGREESEMLMFDNVHEAEYVLKPYKIAERLRRLAEIRGEQVFEKTRADIAEFIGASRERTTLALIKMGRGVRK